MATVRRGMGLSRAGSTTDPPQEAAEPISEAGSASGKTYFKKGKTLHGGLRTEEKSERNYPANTKVRKEGRDAVLQVPEQR